MFGDNIPVPFHASDSKFREGEARSKPHPSLYPEHSTWNTHSR